MLVTIHFNHHFPVNCWDKDFLMKGKQMNTKNNKRRRESIAAIESAFVTLLQERELKDISVTDICKATGLNRSTFYANYADIHDLADKLRQHMEADFSRHFHTDSQNAYAGSDGALRMFRHIYENQIFYKTYFKLGYDKSNPVLLYDHTRAEQDFHGQHIDYHIEFFRAGLNAIILRWLHGGCRETPEEMTDILKTEYRGR